jgi:hypothetical protein
MSVVLSLKQKHFAAVACDGRLSRRRADGGLVAVGEDHFKFRVLTEDIVLACTGSAFIDERLYRRALSFVEPRIDDANLFKELAAFLPVELYGLHALAKQRVDCEGAVAILLGFDAAERRIRRIACQVRGEELNAGEDDEESSSMGNEDAMRLGLVLVEPLERVLPALEAAVRRVSDAVPHSVNRNVRSYLIAPGSDALLDGTTYGRPLNTRLSSGRPLIDFAEGIHVNKHLGNVPDDAGSSRFAVLAVDANRRPIADFSQAHLNKNLDNVPNGTRAAWDTTTQKTAAVDSGGNLLLKNINGVVGVTSSPTTSSAAFTTIPEMTATLTTKGNKILLLFSGSFKCNNPGIACQFAFFRDGIQIGQWVEYTIGTTDVVVSLQYVDSPSAASHTFDVRWETNSLDILTAMSTLRQFQAVELG